MSFTRSIVDAMTRTIGYAVRSRCIRLDREQGPVKLNLGSGLSVIPGWINVDGSLNALIATWPVQIHRCLYKLSGSSQYYKFDEYHAILSSNRFVFYNLEYGLPFSDQCADAIYSSHFLEHLKKEDGVRLLREIYRVLKRGGVLRISVPDLAFAISLHKVDSVRMLEDYFFVEHRGSYFARHKYMYDYDLMKTQLDQIGFGDVCRCTYQKGRLPDVELLDNRPEDSLFVEAIRPR
jgi:SAM-dependent methyltransferase